MSCSLRVEQLEAAAAAVVNTQMEGVGRFDAGLPRGVLEPHPGRRCPLRRLLIDLRDVVRWDRHVARGLGGAAHQVLAVSGLDHLYLLVSVEEGNEVAGAEGHVRVVSLVVGVGMGMEVADRSLVGPGARVIGVEAASLASVGVDDRIGPVAVADDRAPCSCATPLGKL